MTFEYSTHASLLARLHGGGDDAAWREFHDRYHALIRGFARRQGLQPVDADDLAQEVLLAVHKAITTFEYDPARGRFRGYLKTIALRAIWRRRAGASDAAASEAELARLAVDPEHDARWEDEWRQHHLRQALARIRAEFAADEVAAFEQLAIAGQPTDLVARGSGIAADQLYRIKSRILARMRVLIGQQVAEEG